MPRRRKGGNLSRNTINSRRKQANARNRYNYKTNIISWRVEWIFSTVENKPLKFVDEKCLKTKNLSELIDKYLNPDAASFEGSKDLDHYKSVGFSGVKVLLKAEKVKGSSSKFFELDTTKSLAENLSGKCLVEFPIIFIVLRDHADNFEIITPEDEFDYGNENAVKIKKEETNGDCDTEQSSGTSHIKIENGVHKKRQKILLTDKIAEEKKMEIEKEIKE